jgi:protoheme IX farnesyltransferase
VKIYFELIRLKVSLFSALSAAAGYLLASSGWDFRAAAIGGGILLLASGSSALNQYQERERDGLMPRTRNRPLPSGRLRYPAGAFYFSTVLIVAGLCVLYLWGGNVPALLGLFTLLWYNGVYTFLKGRTAFAIIPGSLVGAMPPAIGWVAAGGDPLGSKLFLLCFFFFMWQVPHFWLLLLRYGKEYEQAGMPSLSAIFSREQLSRIVFVWLGAAAVSGVLLTPSGMVRNFAANCALVFFSLWLLGSGTRLLTGRDKGRSCEILFRRTNIYMLLMMAVLAADRF